jgi:Rho-binding antiterminator
MWNLATIDSRVPIMFSNTPAEGREPITCDQHDYLEIACTYRIPISIETMDGEELVFTPRDTKITRDKVEWLLGLRYPDRTDVKVRTDSIASIKALKPNRHFDMVVFKLR